MTNTPSKAPNTARTKAPKLGFTEFAETWNGRLAMIGFIGAIINELVTGKGILSQIGLM